MGGFGKQTATKDEPMKNRKFVPKKARPNTKNYRSNWTATGTDLLFYRHKIDGEVAFATRSESQGKRVWHKLEATSIEAARRETDVIHSSGTEKPSRSGVPTMGDYLRSRVRKAIRSAHVSKDAIEYNEGCLNMILNGYHHGDWKTRENEEGQSVRQGCGACPRQILNKKVDRITSEDLDRWFANAFLNLFSLSSMKGQWSQLKLMFELARKDNLIWSTPVWKVPLKQARGRERRYKNRIGGNAPKIDPVTSDEFFQLVEAIRSNGHPDKTMSEDSANWVAFLGLTGLRKGELEQMRWKDVLWDEKRIRLVGRTKGNQAEVQKLAINPEALSVLRRMWTSGYTREEYVTKSGRKGSRRLFRGSGAFEPSDYVSSIVTGKEALEKACARLGIRRQTPHMLRHFFASECVDQGVPWNVLAEWLGHIDGGILAARTYADVRRGVSESFADNFAIGKRSQRMAS